jgi:anti-sigma-K factor RskA
MLSDRDIELAHPEAFDFAFGNLPRDKRASFNRHLGGCGYCRSVVEEYGGIGAVLKNLPPHVEPPADLEDRTIAAMAAVLAERRATPAARSGGESTEDDATRPHPVPEVHRAADPETRVQPRPRLQPADEPQAKVQPIPQLRPPDGPEARPGSPGGEPLPAQAAARPMVTRPAVWRRYRGRLTAAVAVAAAVIAAAIVLPLSLGGGRINPAQATVVILLHATPAARLDGFGAATGRATGRQDASGSWAISLTVAHLKSFGDRKWYTCWYVSRDGQVASAGTFQVPDSGSWTFPMTSAADPRDFRTMEITLGAPSSNGARAGPVILIGQTL